jgi:hypothetical protein
VEIAGRFRDGWVASLDRADGAEEPEYDEDEKNNTERAAEAASTVTVIPVITAAAAEQQDQHDDNEKRTHGTFFQSLTGSAAPVIIGTVAQTPYSENL